MRLLANTLSAAVAALAASAFLAGMDATALDSGTGATAPDAGVAVDDFDACTCPDMLDLVSRAAVAEEAIKAFQDGISDTQAFEQKWRSGKPLPASNDWRKKMTSDVKKRLSGVGSPKANRADGETDITCITDNRAPTACLKASIASHELVHALACSKSYADHMVTFGDRYDRMTLVEFANEEVASYEAEREFIRIALEKLRLDCEFVLEFRSTITGTLELAQANTKVDVDLSLTLPQGLTGKNDLQYETKDTGGGPPAIIGPPGSKKLLSLMRTCYSTYEGTGTVPFEIVDGWILRDKTPPYSPKIELSLSVGWTQELRRLKGDPICARPPPQPGSFWTRLFVMGKPRISPTAPVMISTSKLIMIDAWTIQPRPDVYAERTFGPYCGGSLAGLPFPLSLGLCAENTTLTLKLKSIP